MTRCKDMNLTEIVLRVLKKQDIQKPRDEGTRHSPFMECSSEEKKQQCYRHLTYLVARRYLHVCPLTPSIYGQEVLRPFFNLKMGLAGLELVLTKIAPQSEISESDYLLNFASEVLRPTGTDLPLYTLPAEEFQETIRTTRKGKYAGSVGLAMLMACSVLGQAESNGLIRIENSRGLEEPLIKRTHFQLELPFTYHA